MVLCSRARRNSMALSTLIDAASYSLEAISKSWKQVLLGLAGAILVKLRGTMGFALVT